MPATASTPNPRRRVLHHRPDAAQRALPTCGRTSTCDFVHPVLLAGNVIEMKQSRPRNVTRTTARRNTDLSRGLVRARCREPSTRSSRGSTRRPVTPRDGILACMGCPPDEARAPDCCAATRRNLRLGCHADPDSMARTGVSSETAPLRVTQIADVTRYRLRDSGVHTGSARACRTSGGPYRARGGHRYGIQPGALWVLRSEVLTGGPPMSTEFAVGPGSRSSSRSHQACLPAAGALLCWRGDGRARFRRWRAMVARAAPQHP